MGYLYLFYVGLTSQGTRVDSSRDQPLVREVTLATLPNHYCNYATFYKKIIGWKITQHSVTILLTIGTIVYKLNRNCASALHCGLGDKPNTEYAEFDRFARPTYLWLAWPTVLLTLLRLLAVPLKTNYLRIYWADLYQTFGIRWVGVMIVESGIDFF